MSIQMPTDEDLEERINLNITKDGLTLEQVKEDTKILIDSLIAQSSLLILQIKIYKKLNQRIDKKIEERDKK